MCVFCEIIKGNIPSYKVYEDEHVLAILDISQATIGHTLVMPKKHYESILDIAEEDLSFVFNAVKRITNHYDKVLGANGYNILNNCKESAGQTVMHFHVHILPRYESDDLSIKFNVHEITQNEFCSLQNKLKLN